MPRTHLGGTTRTAGAHMLHGKGGARAGGDAARAGRLAEDAVPLTSAPHSYLPVVEAVSTKPWGVERGWEGLR
ncbi:hypothetical protein [Streptomyces sp. WAC06614]|uniref:hypothetical protein n=1 Tax=Streptomyces sp. WAC06614 TaxID=2487416 RepID=UPI000F784E28|nr:hypothetical protein [Streptomyces sp. WAC06614]RSS76839.1 hypothetical protein EF918_22630 [Streptomyces sp. WAC06614]